MIGFHALHDLRRSTATLGPSHPDTCKEHAGMLSLLCESCPNLCLIRCVLECNVKEAVKSFQEFLCSLSARPLTLLSFSCVVESAEI